MTKGWDTYSRQGIDLVSAATSFGFNVAKAGTRFGFAVTQGVAGTAVGITATVVDHAFFGGSTITRHIIGGAVSSAISFAEQLTLAPIFLGEYITSTSLIAAHSSINVLSVIFPGSSDASFSLASFITLVRREWTDTTDPNTPTKRYGITQIARAIVAWVALQGVTQEWQEKMWLQHLREIRVNEATEVRSTLSRRNSRIRVTSDVLLPDHSGQLIEASIGEAPRRTPPATYKFSITPLPSPRPRVADPPPRLSNGELKVTLRRLSKMVLAGYGGASLLFFGVSPGVPLTTSKLASEEAQLAFAVDASEAEAAGDFISPPPTPEVDSPSGYSWWDVLLGKHDQEIFERAAGVGLSSQKAQQEIKAKMTTTAISGKDYTMPRYWVLTDHGRGQVVLVLRGTMSLNEIAADLTCDAEDFEPAVTMEEESRPLSGQYAFPSMSHKEANGSSATLSTAPRYHVHSGMLRMARAMGGIGKPVHIAVQEALLHNPDYDLVLCGHSLGAGVAAILGMVCSGLTYEVFSAHMVDCTQKWADLKTCLTVRSSGLPVGRRVFVYCFAPPALADAALSKLANRLIVSFVYSHDVVARLSLGSIRDLRNAASWLCEAENEHVGEGWTAVTNRAKLWKAGEGSLDDRHWFVAVRKSLQANMQMSNMFPPGQVFWALRDSDLHPKHRSYLESTNKVHCADKLRLFEVLDVERVFSQIVFAKDMLKYVSPNP
ncbi:hypothetical protein C0992_005606 [Termitomyces sp. T32_za158]|nr:hypothetical protein C0992_005606 [Termitomyces sp. T32_za158]